MLLYIIRKIIMLTKGDSVNVIAWCSFEGSDPPCEVAPIISDIRSFLIGVDVSFSLVGRSANRVADFVAKNGWIGSDFSRAAIFDSLLLVYG